MTNKMKIQNIKVIPTEYLQPFLADSSKAWQSFGDAAQYSDAPFFENVAKIREAIHDIRNPFNHETYEFDPEFVCNDNFTRYAHIDLGFNRDACGIAMVHMPEFVEVEVAKFDEQQKIFTIRETLPIYKYDFYIRLKAPRNGEIEFSDVREILYEVSQRGFPISLVTYDGFQSIDSIQILRNKGYIVSRLSIDRTATFPRINLEKKDNIESISTNTAYLAAWEAYKFALNTNRIILPKDLIVTDTLIDNYGTIEGNVDDFGNKIQTPVEVTQIEKEMLEAIHQKDKGKEKVIEPPKGSLDVLEACVGALFNASNHAGFEEIEETNKEKMKRLALTKDTSIFGEKFHKKDNTNDLSEPDEDFDDESGWESETF